MQDSFIKNNLSIVVSFIATVFAAGSIFSEFTSLKDEIHLVHNRLDEKITLIGELEHRIVELEKKVEYERGLLDARSN